MHLVHSAEQKEDWYKISNFMIHNPHPMALIESLCMLITQLITLFSGYAYFAGEMAPNNIDVTRLLCNAAYNATICSIYCRSVASIASTETTPERYCEYCLLWQNSNYYVGDFSGKHVGLIKYQKYKTCFWFASYSIYVSNMQLVLKITRIETKIYVHCPGNWQA